MKNKIITLSNKLQYIVCEELCYNNKMYICCVPYNKEKSDLNKLLILQVIYENKDINLIDIDEFKENILRKIFLVKLSENV